MSNKQRIINRLMGVYETFSPEKSLEKPTMFWLISTYNSQYENNELIGGDWVQDNCPDPLKSLP